MPRLTLTALLCITLCFGQTRSRNGPKRIPLGKYGFSVDLPAGWNAAVNDDGLPILVNFPWSKMQAQLRLLRGGGIINVIAWDTLTRRRGDESLAGWAHLDAVIAAPGTVVSRALEVPTSTDISQAIFESFDEATFGPDDQPQHEISVYWTFRLKNFAAHLLYVVGDPKGAEYERDLKRIIFSVKPL